MKCYHCETRSQELEGRPLCKKCAKWVDLCFDTPPRGKDYFGSSPIRGEYIKTSNKEVEIEFKTKKGISVFIKAIKTFIG